MKYVPTQGIDPSSTVRHVNHYATVSGRARLKITVQIEKKA